MSFLFPILAAFLQSCSFTLDKIILEIKGVNFKTYTGVSFPLIFLVNLIIFWIVKPEFSMEILSGTWIFVALSILMTLVTNIMFYRALDDDRLEEIDMLHLLNVFPVILFTSLIFSEERNFFVIIPTLISSAAIVWSHWDHHHFKIAKHTLPYLIWSLLMAPFGAPISKVLLEAWNPISLEVLRTGVLALILGLMFFKQVEKIEFRTFLILVLTNILTSFAWIFFYYSYQQSGVIFTILMFSIQPLLVYFSSVVFLKEPLKWKRALAFFIVLCSIISVQL
jgi:uncharacterized membrane protein